MLQDAERGIRMPDSSNYFKRASGRALLSCSSVNGTIESKVLFFPIVVFFLSSHSPFPNPCL